MIVILGVAEIVVARRIFVVIGKRIDVTIRSTWFSGCRRASMTQSLFATVQPWPNLDAVDTDGACQFFGHLNVIQAILADNLGHVFHH